MTEIVIVLSTAHAAALGSVRTFPGLLAARSGEEIWVRGIPAGKPDKKISVLPVMHTYFMDEQERLFAPAAQTPVAMLPALEWIPLLSFIKVTLPVSALPGVLEAPQRVKLVRRNGNVIIPGNDALLTSLEIWDTYVSTAPLVRLQHLYFAVSENREALIIGTPIMPLPGKTYILGDNILLPAGYDFDPPAITSLVTTTLNPLHDGILLFHENGHWEKIKFDCFVPATRSAVRLTNSMI
ncbi:hypothetical protein GO495_14090 [Chitinophaga oryziterrae]|uniref:MoxR-vWA-beta-propeller ternary system domain-containing protein n=1 Tax=Chitinophaga oryziterrae TaxID=1031224 RepID=A0A6N8J8V7_9BACT|nr:hypothetical protein [Chitinophaga oryziterrae]MVT41715.1 hypothetical protein [Chitinophaga oryziterrae]